MKFSEIPQLIERGGYQTNVHLDYIDERLTEWEQDKEYYSLQLNPDFQRGHVWSAEQRSKFVEFFLMGGVTGRVFYFNKPSWQGEAKTGYDDFVCVDGLQRITSIRMFMRNEIKAFDQLYKDFGQRARHARANSNLVFNINNLQTKSEVLTWYLQMNTGGTIHTDQEINKVKELLEKEND